MNKYIFPQFRAYSNRQSFFKIKNENEFEELKIFDKFYSMQTIVCKMLPDRVLVSDLLLAENSSIIIISESEYEQQKLNCLKIKSKLAL